MTPMIFDPAIAFIDDGAGSQSSANLWFGLKAMFFLLQLTALIYGTYLALSSMRQYANKKKFQFCFLVLTPWAFTFTWITLLLINGFFDLFFYSI